MTVCVRVYSVCSSTTEVKILIVVCLALWFELLCAWLIAAYGYRSEDAIKILITSDLLFARGTIEITF